MTATQAPSTAKAAPLAPPQRRSRRWATFCTLAVAVVLVSVASASVGQLGAGAGDVIGSLLQGIGVHTPLAPTDDLTYQALWQIRFPRVAMSLLVGAALALGGAIMQAIFGNPLAEPGVVGVSSGAALGAAVAIAFGATGLLGPTTAAFVTGVACTALVYLAARSGGRTEVVTLLLTGIAVQAFASAGMAYAVFASDQAGREQIIFWQLGSLNGSSWQEAGIVAALVGVGGGAALCFSRQYDLLALGERTAGHLGVRVEWLRGFSVLIVAVLTAGAVTFTGVIGFVGLIVPHLMRLLLGPSHKALLPASVLGGAVLVALADTLARTLVTSADLPIGMLTSLIGGPFFFYLIRRSRRRSGGWA